jgi:uncharacterized protein (TIGR02246 family)
MLATPPKRVRAQFETMFYIADVKSDTTIEAELIGVLERFCSAFADRDAEAVIHLFVDDGDVVVVTSEEPLLRGAAELIGFLNRYVNGPTTYSWAWDRHDVAAAGSVAWLLAEGTETATSADHAERHPYRMTMVLERHSDHWLLRQVHGSSPH